jgi:hypothetical protein
MIQAAPTGNHASRLSLSQGLLFKQKHRRYETAHEAIAARRTCENAVVVGGGIGSYFATCDIDDMPEEKHAVLGRDRRLAGTCELTTLSFSGGRQSTWILEAVLRGEVERPDPFLVVTANPGAEKQRTYDTVAKYKTLCEEAGIAFVVADGPKLSDDLLAIQRGDKHRIDNPPMWTRAAGDTIPDPEKQSMEWANDNRTLAYYHDAIANPDRYRTTREQRGAAGQLAQCCTAYYKVAPIRRAIRTHLEKLTGSRRVWPGIAETWIGFADHERWRAAKAKEDVRWQKLRFPMIERGIGPDRVHADWKRWGLGEPAISMCNMCPFQGIRSLRDMYENHSEDWVQAAFLDRKLRDFAAAGAKNQVFCSQTLVPLELLPILDFQVGEDAVSDLQCDSGLCFM